MILFSPARKGWVVWVSEWMQTQSPFILSIQLLRDGLEEMCFLSTCVQLRQISKHHLLHFRLYTWLLAPASSQFGGRL